MTTRTESQPNPSTSAVDTTASNRASRRLWPAWALLGFLAFLATQLTVLAFALQGKWFVLIGPAIVCGFKAWSTWQWIRPQIQHDDHPPV